MLFYSAKYFPQGLVNLRGKQRKLMFARREIRSLPQYGAQLSNQSWTCSPARPETNTLLLIPCRNLLVWENFHSLLSVLYFHTSQVLLEGRKPESVFWVIFALLLESSKGEATDIPFSSQGGWCSVLCFFSWKGMQHTIGGDATLALSVLSPQFGVFPRGPAESSEGFLSYRRTWTSTAALDSLPLIPLGLLQTSQEIS